MVWIAGNHDRWIERKGIGRKLRSLKDAHDLQDMAVEIGGLKVYDSPWTSGLGVPDSWWAFDLLTIPGEADPFAQIPDDTDVLVTHSPPFGYGDALGNRRRLGSMELYRRIVEVRPRLVVHGHIHEEYGVRAFDHEVVVANAALLDTVHEPVNGRNPLVFEL